MLADFTLPPMPESASEIFPKTSQNLPTWSQDRAKMAQVAPKTPILAPSWRILGVTLRILAPTLAEFLQKLLRHRAAGQKRSLATSSRPRFFSFWTPPGSDFRDFSNRVFLVVGSIFHLRFMPQAIFRICGSRFFAKVLPKRLDS